MNHLSLKKYIEHGSLIQNINNNDWFDCIVYDVYENNELTIEQKLPLYVLSNGASLTRLLEKYSCILFVITKTGLQDYISILQKLPLTIKKLCVVSTDTGVASGVGKGWKDMNDEAKANEIGLNTVDPYDFVGVLSYFPEDGKTYIRIQNGEYPNKLLDTSQNFKETGGTHSLEKIGLSGPNGTVLMLGRHTHDALSALIKLQEEGMLYDGFIIESLEFSFNDSLRNSLLRTERLILLYNGSDKYATQTIQSKLFEAGLTDVEVEVICPDHTDHRSLQPEYIYHEAGFSVESFLNALQVH